jgi:hypothetical protein
MWQTDTVTLQTSTTVNYNGAITLTWSDSTAVTCDVQDINREYVYKNYGLTDATEYKQVFDHTNASWVKGNQCKYDSEQWMIKLVNSNMEKMTGSNHTFVILAKVIA